MRSANFKLTQCFPFRNLHFSFLTSLLPSSILNLPCHDLARFFATVRSTGCCSFRHGSEQLGSFTRCPLTGRCPTAANVRSSNCRVRKRLCRCHRLRGCLFADSVIAPDPANRRILTTKFTHTRIQSSRSGGRHSALRKVSPSAFPGDHRLPNSRPVADFGMRRSPARRVASVDLHFRSFSFSAASLRGET